MQEAIANLRFFLLLPALIAWSRAWHLNWRV